jgi:hypothetical protein
MREQEISVGHINRPAIVSACSRFKIDTPDVSIAPSLISSHAYAAGASVNAEKQRY